VSAWAAGHQRDSETAHAARLLSPQTTAGWATALPTNEGQAPPEPMTVLPQRAASDF
jgi:hypothetical protein